MAEELNINIPSDAIIFKGKLKNGKNYLVEMEILDKDISNFEKAILDFLKGKLFTDDHFVKLNLKMPVLADPQKKGYVVIDTNPDIFRV